MYLNTTFKAFVAETAAKVAAEISKAYTSHQDVSILKDDAHAEIIAIAAVNVADNLAQKLDEWWHCKGDRSTVMFDVDDTPMTRLENAIGDVSEKLQETSDSLNDIRVALCDKGDIDQDPIHMIAESLYKMQGDTDCMANGIGKIASEED